jgi:N-formylglutamate amidohydrolase
MGDYDPKFDASGWPTSWPQTVIHIPHASTAIPDDVRATFVLSDAMIERELLRLTDRYTDELFGLDPAIATSVVYGVSRLVVDPERFTDDATEPMAAQGMGAVYTSTTDGTPLRSRLDASERAALLVRFYEPHHAALEAATHAALDATGRCLIVDAHSFPDGPLGSDLDQAPERPETCIGTDAFHTPGQLATEAVDGFKARGLEVAVNRPYAGALVPALWYRRDKRVSAVMIEINRRLYMDETTGQKNAGFAETRATVQSVVTGLVASTA